METCFCVIRNPCLFKANSIMASSPATKTAFLPPTPEHHKKTTSNTMAQELGRAFISFFYQCYDGDRTQLQTIYVGTRRTGHR